MSRPAEYLAIPEEYGRWLGGLRWAENGEAVEFVADDPAVGLTFAMAGEIARFLKGLHAVRSPISFAYVLHLLILLGVGSGLSPRTARFSRLRARRVGAAFRDAGRPLRNAGALFGMVCRDIPRATDPPDLADLEDFLTWWPVGPDEPAPVPTVGVPSLEPEEFQERVNLALDALSDEDLRHWLKHGRGPVADAGKEVARATIAARPRSLDETLRAVARRPKLALAAPLVAHLAGALVLPARRLADVSLPQGGYADVTTRGHPEQILPSQFALDDLELLRRFAARELLYYHREQPRTTAEEAVVLLLDQGVRAWGDVRLVLAAATLALLRQVGRKGAVGTLGTTGTGGVPAAVAELAPEALGTLLEASDLSPNPGLALERVLQTPAQGFQDVVVLTHPRNLLEGDVASAARRAGPGTLLFAVTVDGAGCVELSALRHGMPVALARCRVTLADPTVPPPTAIAVEPAAPGLWRGDVEPIGFPFRLGVVHPLDHDHYAFDRAGEWLLAAAGTHGLLFAWKIDGTAMEMLPRGFLDGRPVVTVDAVLGVAGGFVVGARHDQDLVAIHYDFPTRTCTAHRLGPPPARDRWPAGGRPEWEYQPQIHTVVVRNPEKPTMAHAVDLDADRSIACFRFHDPEAPVAKRAKVTCSESADHFSPRWSVPRVGIHMTGMAAGSVVGLDAKTGAILWLSRFASGIVHTPLADGRPALAGGQVLAARLEMCTFMVLARDARHQGTLFVYHLIPGGGRPGAEHPVGPSERGFVSWRLEAEHRVGPSEQSFALSADGTHFARRVGNYHLEVCDVGTTVPPRLVTTKGRIHPRLSVGLGDSCLSIQVGRYCHIIRWDGSLLTIASLTDPPEAQSRVRGLIVDHARTIPNTFSYDPRRFVAGCRASGLTALVDVFGHVAILDVGNVLVAMFHVFRGDVAAWLPDGTKWGPAATIGGPPTPSATEKIAAALRAAEKRGAVS